MSVRDDQLDTLKVDGKDYEYYRIADLPGIDHLPYSLKFSSRTWYVTSMAPTSRMIMSRHCWIGIRLHSRVMRSSSPRPAWSCRISPACPALWILPPCVMRSRILGRS